MWLMKYVTKNSITRGQSEQGSIGGNYDGKVQVNASSEFRNIPVLAPYGIAYVPVVGEKSIVLPTSHGDICLGVLSKGQHLQPGELMLFSSGGASIQLKNDGNVYINGKKYA
ncbi:MAG: hypothetical protein ACI4Q8_03750 [Ruminococcus sp.]